VNIRYPSSLNLHSYVASKCAQDLALREAPRPVPQATPALSQPGRVVRLEIVACTLPIIKVVVVFVAVVGRLAAVRAHPTPVSSAGGRPSEFERLCSGVKWALEYFRRLSTYDWPFSQHFAITASA
jgi:hypothetical protein